MITLDLAWRRNHSSSPGGHRSYHRTLRSASALSLAQQRRLGRFPGYYPGSRSYSLRIWCGTFYPVALVFYRGRRHTRNRARTGLFCLLLPFCSFRSFGINKNIRFKIIKLSYWTKALHCGLPEVSSKCRYN